MTWRVLPTPRVGTATTIAPGLGRSRRGDLYDPIERVTTAAKHEPARSHAKPWRSRRVRVARQAAARAGLGRRTPHQPPRGAAARPGRDVACAAHRGTTSPRPQWHAVPHDKGAAGEPRRAV